MPDEHNEILAVEEIEEIVDRPFGEYNRGRLIQEWFQDKPVTPENAWIHVYRLLLWTDPTTGLAHCYESDKSQPGRTWYARSLSFHAWLSQQLGVAPLELGTHIDWMFRAAVDDLARYEHSLIAKRAENYTAQRAVFEGVEMPEPGDHAELQELIAGAIDPYLRRMPEREVWRALSERVFRLVSQENKRKNLVGEGFEDVVAGIISRVESQVDMEVRTRRLIQEVPGFYPPRATEKEKKLDLVILRGPQQDRILATAKWSIRSDREEQLAQDLDAYARLESLGRPFQYVLLTNEFDPARLTRACERMAGHRRLFDKVVHVNPRGVLAAYDEELRRSARKVSEHIQTGRLIGVGQWITELTTA